jgi:hypothetical protein
VALGEGLPDGSSSRHNYSAPHLSLTQKTSNLPAIRRSAPHMPAWRLHRFWLMSTITVGQVRFGCCVASGFLRSLKALVGLLKAASVPYVAWELAITRLTKHCVDERHRVRSFRTSPASAMERHGPCRHAAVPSGALLPDAEESSPSHTICLSHLVLLCPDATWRIREALSTFNLTPGAYIPAAPRHARFDDILHLDDLICKNFEMCSHGTRLGSLSAV